jgi:HAD superfamily hydrolase (TIGR01484 family)
MKKVIAFDLDGTLAPSKSPLPDRMAAVLRQLLAEYEVCVISGGKFGQFEAQLLGNLEASDEELAKLHIMPTCGTRYYRYEQIAKEWQIQYAEDFTESEKKKIIEAVNETIKDFGYDNVKTYGPQIEDRGSQISWSALGQDIVTELGLEGVRLKEEWDPSNDKKFALRDAIALKIPEFEVRSGGVTTIDITKLGIDKAYGMRKLMEALGVGQDDILFLGDRLQEGGNDYPVKAMGIDTVAVKTWEETAVAVEVINKVTK